ncbi:MAG: hypothetical protein DRP11_01980 [Candidatus Aenigmatarchaeota archaeon]|nr:MAG: hypothetical protein DRP11_01980 [Candidatus Aenigmarchaeota archaeon]
MTERIYYLVRRIKVSPYTYAELYYRRGRYYIYFRDILTGRFTRRQPFYRVSVTINDIPVHNKYYNAIFQTWISEYIKENYLEELYEFGEKELIGFIEDALGYSQEEWWFKYEVDYECIPIPPDYHNALELFENLFWYELRYENKYGMTIMEVRYPLPTYLNPSRW